MLEKRKPERRDRTAAPRPAAGGRKRAFLGAIQKTGISVFAVTHGDFTRPQSWNYIASTESAVRNFLSREEPLLFCGHTHHAMIWEATANGVFREKFAKRFAHPAVKPQTISFQGGGSRYIVNVGSVGYPRYDLCSCYAIYDSCTDKVIVRRLPFDFNSYVKAMLSRKMNLPGWLCSLLQLARSQS